MLSNITKCTNLRSIRFYPIRLSLMLTSPYNEFMLRILNRVSSSCIEEVSFGVEEVGTDEAADTIDWSAIADALLRPQFINLKRVRIEWPILRAPFAKKYFAEGPFSSMTRRGLVQLKFL